MERAFLDDTVIYMRKCSSQKLPAGKPGPHVILLYHCRRTRFHSLKIIVQCGADDTHEHRKPAVISIADGRSTAKSAAVYRFCLPRRLQLKPGIYLSGGHCRPGKTGRCPDGDFR